MSLRQDGVGVVSGRPRVSSEVTGTGKVTRMLSIGGSRRTVTLTSAVWSCLQEIAEAEQRSVNAIIADVAARAGGRRLAASIEVFVVGYLRLGRPPAAV